MRTLFVLGMLVSAVTPMLAKSVKIHGYVTSVNSPAEFEIEDYRITHDLSLVLEFEKTDKEEIIFRPEDIRIGTEVEIKGELNETTHLLTAKSIKINLDEHNRVKRTALMEKAPELKRVGNKWEGSLYADGQTISVKEESSLNIRRNNTEKKIDKEMKKAVGKKVPAKVAEDIEDSGSDEATLEALASREQIGSNMFISYEGTRQKDGTILAKKVDLTNNELTRGESRLWKMLTPKVKLPAYTSGRPGELRLRQVRYKLAANAELQKYVQDLGASLVPAWQKSLENSNPNKIPFQFFVVENKLPNAFATANGVVVIHTSMISSLENEAQLAAVIGHEIAHSMQKHTYRQMEFHKKKLMALKIGAAVGAAYGGKAVMDLANLAEAAIRNGYSRSLENQADRVGTEYMLAAGFDPREAPRVWKVMTQKFGDHPTNFFWSSHDNNTARRSYLMAELKNNYSNLDFASYKKDSERFATAVVSLSAMYNPKSKKLKVKY